MLHAQACCAGASALTPGRLVMHEQALVGAQVRASLVLGSFDASGSHSSLPSGASDVELEQDLFGAVRLFKHGQVALLVPFLEASRADRSGSEFGGGLGDLNLSARYDFYSAGRSRYVPGVAVLAGVTLPTGTPPESASGLHMTNATGLGVVQGTFGLAVEQIYGRVVLDLTGLVAIRANRTLAGLGNSALAPQWTGILGFAYAFDNGASLGLAAAYSAEGTASLDGMDLAGTGRRRTFLTVSGLWPIDDSWRLLGNLLWDLPIDSLGKNQPYPITGLGVTVIHSWS
jgi:hypothetical protein